MKYIYHHLGLGDHVICNGMVRYFYKNFNEIKLFCKKHNSKNVKYMYSDLEKLELIVVETDRDVEQIIKNNNIENETIRVGFNALMKYIPQYTFDVAFYKTVGLDFNVRFNDFKVPRNLIKENEVLRELNPKNESYIFVHDDKSRGFSIDHDKLPKNKKIIYNDMKYSIFDMLGIIENADEVHVMQSSIKDLINSFKFIKPKFFLHNYVRGYDNTLNSIGLNNFEIVE